MRKHEYRLPLKCDWTKAKTQEAGNNEKLQFSILQNIRWKFGHYFRKLSLRADRLILKALALYFVGTKKVWSQVLQLELVLQIRSGESVLCL